MREAMSKSGNQAAADNSLYFPHRKLTMHEFGVNFSFRVVPGTGLASCVPHPKTPLTIDTVGRGFPMLGAHVN